MFNPTEPEPLELSRIRDAHQRIKGLIHRTPVMTSSVLDAAAGASLFFKCENFQKAGSFKSRGATNAVFSLTNEDAARGVVAHSSGNHAAALSRAARLRGIRAFVVMPRTAPKVKQAAVKRYGGEIILCDPSQDARENTAQQVLADTGGTMVHAYDDRRVLAGQGTTALELLEEVPDLDVMLCAVGGGGHLSGVAVAAKGLRPEIRVIGVEPAGADDAAQSFNLGRLVRSVQPKTIADGLMTSLCDRTFAEIRRHVDAIVTVSEDGILRGMRSIWEVMKILVEPSGAVSYAAVCEGRLDVRGKRVGVILSGGNLDLDSLPW
jgi:threonine dehydratase